MKPGDEAWLTVPSRDSSGYPKGDIGHFTILVKVLDVHPLPGGRQGATVAPSYGEGEARIDIARLKPLAPSGTRGRP